MLLENITCCGWALQKQAALVLSKQLAACAWNPELPVISVSWQTVHAAQAASKGLCVRWHSAIHGEDMTVTGL